MLLLQAPPEQQTVERILPVIRQLTLYTFWHEGWQPPDPAALIYKIRIEDDPVELWVDISQPVCGHMLLRWLNPVQPFLQVDLWPTSGVRTWSMRLANPHIPRLSASSAASLYLPAGWSLWRSTNVESSSTPSLGAAVNLPDKPGTPPQPQMQVSSGSTNRLLQLPERSFRCIELE